MKQNLLHTIKQVPFKKSVFALCSVFVLAACGGGGASSEPEPKPKPQPEPETSLTVEEGYKKIAESLVSDTIIPSYALMHEQSQLLEAATTVFCALPNATQSDLNTLQTAWKNTNNAWQIARTLKFGPIADTFIYSQIQFWPISSTKVANDVENALNSDEDFSQDFDIQKHQLQGLPAFEYVIFNQNETTAFLSSENKEARCKFLGAIAGNIESLAANVVTQWQGDFGQDFKQGTGNFNSHAQALEKFLTSWFEYLEIINDDKLKEPLHEKAPGKPELIESAFANVSINNIQINLTALEQQFNGSNGFGFDEYLTQVSDRGDVSDEVLLHFAAVQAALAALENKPLPALLADENEREKLAVLRKSITELRALMSTDFVQVTDLAPGFNTNDGD